MTNTYITSTILAFAIGFSVSVPLSAQEISTLPAKINKDEIAGSIFDRLEAEPGTEDGVATVDVTTFMSSDGKFGTGMWKTEKVRYEVTEPWGVDEFFYIVDGSLTLTSSDGTVQVINAGEAVTISKEWTGIWDTEGFTQVWVIYSEDGSGLE